MKEYNKTETDLQRTSGYQLREEREDRKSKGRKLSTKYWYKIKCNDVIQSVQWIWPILNFIWIIKILNNHCTPETNISELYLKQFTNIITILNMK